MVSMAANSAATGGEKRSAAWSFFSVFYVRNNRRAATYRNQFMRSTGNSYRAVAIPTPATKALVLLWSAAAVIQVGSWLLQTSRPRGLGFWLSVCGFTWEDFQDGRWWGLLTYAFVQGSVWHWLLAMVGLCVFGRSVEPIVGSVHLLVATAFGTVIGGLAHGLACHYGLLPAGQPLWGALPMVLSLVGIYSTVLPGWHVGGSSRWLRLGSVRAREVGWIAAGCCVLWWRSRWWGAAGPLAMLASLCVGWGYTRVLGFGGTLFYQRMLRRDDPHLRRLEAMTGEEFLNLELNPVLEKIARRGLKSLTRAERQTLQYSRRKLEGW